MTNIMNAFFIVTLLSLTFVSVRAQTTQSTVQGADVPGKKDTAVFVAVEQNPGFPGGIGKLMEYINKNLKYPKVAKQASLEGRVIVSFVVERDGSLTGIKVRKSLSPETDAEAIRLIMNSPKWVPGMQGGRAVRVQYSIPITFKLND